LDDRRSELLDTQYFHVIFTVPQPIATIALQNKASSRSRVGDFSLINFD
jgi:hypothetical protein